MRDFAVVRRAPREAPDFQEELYEHLKGTPWYLASAGLHGLAFAVFAVLAGEAVAPPASAAAAIAWNAPPPDLDDEEIRIDPERVPPLDQPIDTDVPIVIEENLKEAEIRPEEFAPEENLVDDRFPPGPFLGDGASAAIGVGGDAGGGGPAFGQRSIPGLKAKAKDVLPATEAGLDWLARHQSPDGRWDADGFEARCTGNRCGGAGGPLHDAGLTGLSLLAFLGYGETHRSPKYGHVVRAGLKYLKGIQDAEGCFGPRTGNHYVYDHALASLAMVEAYGMTRSLLFRASAQAGVDFVHATQNPYLAWRYGVRPQDNDTSVTGWMVMVLKSAVLSDLRVDPAAFDGARAWLDKVTEPEYGRAGYTARGNGPARPPEFIDRFPSDKSESMTAVAVLSRIFTGAKTDDPMVRKGADLCLKSLPAWDEAAGTIDYYYWYYGTLAMFQVGGDSWKRWYGALKGAVVDHQRLEAGDDRRGSWDPIDPWAAEGGRIYATAINTLTLEIWYRYAHVVGTK